MPCYIVRFNLIVLLLSVYACASVPPAKPDNVCSIFKEKRGWHKAAVRAQQKWGTSMHIPMAIMYQESSFQRKARPPRRKLLGFIPWKRPSSAYGYAQEIDGTWLSYVKATGQYGHERSNFADATDFIHWYINQARNKNGVSKTDAFSLYLNYHEGTTGYAQGTYKNKAWLNKAALGVQRRSEKYTIQYSQCKDSLQPGFFGRLLGW
jgi:hypothetical protein